MGNNTAYARLPDMNFSSRTIVLVDEQRRSLALAMVQNAPIGIEIVAREVVKARKPDQNARMWRGPLRDMEESAWFNGRQYSADVWHEYMKREYLPEDDDVDLARKVKDVSKWHKWAYTPKGDRILVGSTTQLTVRGFAEYMEAIYAFGAGLGVMFSASPNEAVR